MSNFSNPTSTKIQNLAQETMGNLSPHLQLWAKSHLIEPREIILSDDAEGITKSAYWLVTDHTGQDDSSYRVVYDTELNGFGISCKLMNGPEYCLGIYGTFAEAISNM